MSKKSASPKDDLTQIPGVGQRTQDKLHQAGILTYVDLANATGDGLRAAIPTAGQSKREAWQAAARQLAQDGGVQSTAYQHTNSKGRTYILHSRNTQLKNGRTQTIYFFAKEAQEGAINAVPEGYEVSETRNGLPVLKRKK